MKLFIPFLAIAVLSTSAVGQSLYSLSGKNYELKDLSPPHQQQLFEIQYETYEKTRQSIDNIVIESYFDEEANKQSKPRDEVANTLLDVKEPSEKEIKKWYEDNKSRIPPNYKFDDIKADISKFVKQEKMKTKRDELLEKIKKERKFSLALAKPVAPVLDVKIEGFQSKGKDDAKVTIVEFADYQCPHCKTAAESMKKVNEKMKGKVKFVYIDYPVNPSGVSKAIAETSHCVAEQGKYWEFHYKAFENQAKLEMSSPDSLAKELKVDDAKLKACMAAGKGKAIVDKGRAEGERLGITGTPFILINGRRYIGAHTVEAITKEVETYLK